jgi:hypothetical protein
MKRQIKVQKIVCYIILFSCAIAFVFALGLATNIYNLMFAGDFDIKGYKIFEDIQPFNRELIVRCILMIVLVVFLFITRSHLRRRYYISNYVVTTFSALINVFISIWAISNILDFKQRFLTEVDFEGWLFIREIMVDFPYTESTLWLDLNIIIFSLVIFASLLLIGNLIWKIMLMKFEDKLLAGQIKPVNKPKEV